MLRHCWLRNSSVIAEEFRQKREFWSAIDVHPRVEGMASQVPEFMVKHLPFATMRFSASAVRRPSTLSPLC